MLTSSNQYLRPDYLSPLPTTLDAKKSPLALLAQTCSAIGADTPNPKLISAAEKASSKSGHRYAEAARDESPVVHAPADGKPSFKPYESCLTTRDKSGSPEEAPAGRRSKTPVSSKGSAATTPAAARCASNQSSSSQPRASPGRAERRSPAERASPRRASPPAEAAPAPAAARPFAASPPAPAAYRAAAFLGGPPPSGFALPMDLMAAAHHHALKGGLHPYLAYARLKAGAEACRDPYCACAGAAKCPAGCAQCDHGKFAGHPAAAAYAHAQLAALAAAAQPFVCSWMAGDAAYCGKRFASSEELLQHLRSHTAAAAAEGAPHALLARAYAAPRFHPYKPGPLVSPLAFPLAPPPSLAAYFPSYPQLFGPRPLHP